MSLDFDIIIDEKKCKCICIKCDYCKENSKKAMKFHAKQIVDLWEIQNLVDFMVIKDNGKELQYES